MDFRVRIQSITARYKETESDQKWRWGSLASSLRHKPVLSFPCGKTSSHLDDSVPGSRSSAREHGEWAGFFLAISQPPVGVSFNLKT